MNNSNKESYTLDEAIQALPQIFSILNEILSRMPIMPISANNIGNDFMNINETAQFIKKHKATIYGYVFNKKIPHIKSGKTLLFSKSELTQWLNEKRVNISKS